MQKVSHKIVELAEIKHGDKVLDIATGIGESAVTAETRVKPNGKVVATDFLLKCWQLQRQEPGHLV